MGSENNQGRKKRKIERVKKEKPSLVIDTNVLITFFWKNSYLKNNIDKYLLFSPAFALIELLKYKEISCIKNKLSDNDYFKLYFELFNYVKFIDIKEYSIDLKKVPDYGDIDFLALAHKLNIPLWSNDKILKEQTTVNVLNTGEVIELI